MAARATGQPIGPQSDRNRFECDDLAKLLVDVMHRRIQHRSDEIRDSDFRLETPGCGKFNSATCSSRPDLFSDNPSKASQRTVERGSIGVGQAIDTSNLCLYSS